MGFLHSGLPDSPAGLCTDGGAEHKILACSRPRDWEKKQAQRKQPEAVRR